MNIKPTNNTFFRPVERTLMFAAREAGEAAKNDKALVMRAGATALVPSIMQGVDNPTIAETTNKWIVPVVRTALLGLNVDRALETFKNPSSTRLEKGMDVLRVASDLVGFAGGIAMLFSPAHAQIGAKMIGAAYAVDIVSHAYRGLTHANRRIDVWQAEQHGPNGPNGPSDPNKPDGPNNGSKPPSTLTVIDPPPPPSSKTLNFGQK